MTSYKLALALAAWTQHLEFYRLLESFVTTVAVFSEFFYLSLIFNALLVACTRF